MHQLTTLTEDQAQHFLERGYVVIRNAIPRDFTEEQQRRMWVRLGYDPNDTSTWARARIAMQGRDRWDVSELAPEAWGAVLDLVGGEDRVVTPYTWSDGFIVNLGVMADQPWQEPSREFPGWHKDGDFFRHFLDSPEQGLLTLVLWTDVRSRGGATFIVTDSVPAVARYLAKHPEGVTPEELRAAYPQILSECNQFAEATGSAGDVYILHPYMLHATAPNLLRDRRAITNPPIKLKSPMCFDRADGAHSLLERAVLRGLGVDRYSFVPTHARETANPPSRQARLAEHEASRQLEDDRLAAAGKPLHWQVPASV